MVNTTFSACHCSVCRRWSGGAPFFAVRTKSVSFASQDAIGRYASSAWADRGFCKQCGATLFYFLKPASTYLMSVGTFDDAAAFHLALEVFADNKPAGYELSGAHPRWTEAETLARLAPPAK